MNVGDSRRLQDVYSRTSASMLQYLRGAALYAGKDRALLNVLNRVADEEATLLADLANTLEARRIALPAAGGYPFQFTDLNFVGVRSVLPKLRAEFREHLTALEADAAAVSDADAKRALQSLLDSHRKYLGELDALLT